MSFTEEKRKSIERLQKAAPDLLDACKNIKSLIDLGYAEKVISAPNNFHVNLDKALKQIQKAIAKAESEG